MAQFKWQLILLAFVFGQKYYAEARSTIKPRVINGSPAVAKQFPYQVYIEGMKPLSNDFYEKYGCGGVIISKRRILTAAHCINSAHEFYELCFGAVNKENRQETGQQRMTVMPSDIVVHPGYDKFFNDIALIKLPVDLEFNAYIQPAKLPDPSKSYDNENAIASGWGKTNFANEIGSDILLYIDVTILPFDESNIELSESWIGTHPSKSSLCFGDSGGPLAIKNNDGSSTLIGIASLVMDGTCPLYSPNAFTRVSFFLEWIHQNE